MIKTKQIILIFLPAIVLAALALFVRSVQYKNIFQGYNQTTTSTSAEFVPVFEDDPVLGNRQAPNKLVFFGDFACEACREQNYILDQILKLYPEKIKIIWKGLPVVKIPISSEEAHKYAFCLNKQNKFAEFKTMAYNLEGLLNEENLKQIASELKADENKLQSCLNSKAHQNYLENTKQTAIYLNTQSVPTFFLNEKQINPPQTLDGWINILNLPNNI